MRMGRRLSFDIERPAELDPHPFPPMMLLSLVENAVKHGIEPKAEGGHILIRAAVVRDKLVVVVHDTGRGLPEQTTDGVGLSNIRDRLLALYGDAARIDLEQAAPQGVEARISLPHA